MEPLNNPNQSFLSTLPREKGWFTDDPWLYNYQGFWYTASHIETFLSQSQSSRWNLSPSHTLLCCNPKCGTTWLKALTFAIVTRNRYQHCPSYSPLLTSGPHGLVPFLETPDSVQDHNVQNLNLPLFSTHLPYSFLPKSVLDCGCKFIYICRDPKDAFISKWHFLNKLRSKRDSCAAPLIPLEQAFDLFCNGISPFGPFWDHILEYWKSSLDHPERILFLKYEDMMRDPITHVISVAKFMGFPFSTEEEMDGVPLKIVEMCSFDKLSNFEVNKSVITTSGFGYTAANSIYFRKGKIGDWRNHLTAEMADKIDEITKKKLGPYGLRL